MAQISNFNSVFEIAFGVNALLYFYTSRPLLKEKVYEFLKQSEKVMDIPNINEFTSSTIYDWMGIVGALYTKLDRLLFWLSMILSLASLAILVYAGFYPLATIQWHNMLLLIAVLTLPTPILVSVQHLFYGRILIQQLKKIRFQELENINSKKNPD